MGDVVGSQDGRERTLVGHDGGFGAAGPGVGRQAVETVTENSYALRTRPVVTEPEGQFVRAQRRQPAFVVQQQRADIRGHLET